MFNFSLFFRRTKVFLKYRFLTYKFRFLKFLGNFIPHFKPMSYTEEQVLKEIRNYLKKHIESFNNNKKECIISEGKFSMESIDYNRYHIKYNLEYTIEYFVQYELISIPNLEFCLSFDCYPKDIKIRIELLTSFDVSDELFLDKLKPFLKYIKEIKDKKADDILTSLEKYKNYKSGIAGFIFHL